MRELHFELPDPVVAPSRPRLERDERPTFRHTPKSPEAQRRRGQAPPSRPAGPLIWRTGPGSF